MRIIVVGAGVIGLSCAVRLCEAGHEVHVLARSLPLETTSAVAAAMWHPYRALPRERVAAWGRVTFEEFAGLAATAPGSGIRMRRGREYVRGPATEPWWRAAVPALSRLDHGAVPPGYGGGWQLELPVADMSVYLPWLSKRLTAAGGTITRHSLTSLPHEGFVVNCTGLSARGLAGDPSVYPVRGQVVLVAQPGIEEWVLDQHDPRDLVYVVPRLREVVVGGTAGEGEWNLAPVPEVTEAILARATALVPALASAKILGVRVGLRPARPEVRLEAQQLPGGGTLVHCYGHGGAGVTLSWGCAAEVAGLIAAATA
jgi:D-amino-acid oxidase